MQEELIIVEIWHVKSLGITTNMSCAKKTIELFPYI